MDARVPQNVHAGVQKNNCCCNIEMRLKQNRSFVIAALRMRAFFTSLEMISAAGLVCIPEYSRYDHWLNQIWGVIVYQSRCRPHDLEHIGFSLYLNRSLSPVPASHFLSQKLASWGWAEAEWGSWAPAAHILYLDNTDQTKSRSSRGWATVCYLVWCGTRDTHGGGERGRQVIQDYSADMSFPWTCYSCSIVFCVKRRVQPHLSAPNSLAPINGAPWTSIHGEIMSSRCLVNANPPPNSRTLKLPFAHFQVCRALQ